MITCVCLFRRSCLPWTCFSMIMEQVLQCKCCLGMMSKSSLFQTQELRTCQDSVFMDGITCLSQAYSLACHLSQSKIIFFILSFLSPFWCYLRSFPGIALRIAYCAQFHTWSARALSKMAAFSLRLDLAIEVNRHFFENECGDL